jgi:hypothetical protein
VQEAISSSSAASRTLAATCPTRPPSRHPAPADLPPAPATRIGNHTAPAARRPAPPTACPRGSAAPTERLCSWRRSAEQRDRPPQPASHSPSKRCEPCVPPPIQPQLAPAAAASPPLPPGAAPGSECTQGRGQIHPPLCTPQNRPTPLPIIPCFEPCWRPSRSPAGKQAPRSLDAQQQALGVKGARGLLRAAAGATTPYQYLPAPQSARSWQPKDQTLAATAPPSCAQVSRSLMDTHVCARWSAALRRRWSSHPPLQPAVLPLRYCGGRCQGRRHWHTPPVQRMQLRA